MSAKELKRFRAAYRAGFLRYSLLEELVRAGILTEDEVIFIISKDP